MPQITLTREYIGGEHLWVARLLWAPEEKPLERYGTSVSDVLGNLQITIMAREAKDQAKGVGNGQ